MSKAIMKGFINADYMKKNVRRWQRDDDTRVRKQRNRIFGNQMSVALKKAGVC